MIDAEHLARLPARDENGLLHAFIECPKGNTHKIDLDKKLGIFRWAIELPEGLTFPANFGFIPATLAEDGDALDVMVLTGGALPSGTLVAVRPVAVLKLEQDEGGQMVRNDRLVGVPPLSQTFGHISKLSDLRETMMWELGVFFQTYNKLIDRKVRLLDPGDEVEAEKLAEDAIAAKEAAEG
ncbi:inorganic diphosphatase [Aurantiacibacter poecillastricola]|uniref:inorganic diphosphatase n=1 Tax=Aurantiacibacter poecillastricola TaxID=3064385 RepID=UPI00273D40CC|nr:inorganic diphosphatase [Aurantiacibacter sp. 219JJ12-13]MDP5261081.1 inorganic diphosphatase [Aurantiacibacter sp. 219JJ12-13]